MSLIRFQEETDSNIGDHYKSNVFCFVPPFLARQSYKIEDCVVLNNEMDRKSPNIWKTSNFL